MRVKKVLEELERKYNEAVEEERQASLEWFDMSPAEQERNSEVWDDIMKAKGQRYAYWYMIEYIKQNGDVKIR